MEGGRKMGYSVCVEWTYLRCGRDISRELSEEGRWYLKYFQTGEGMLAVKDINFKWDGRAFVGDLLRLRDLGVRGSLAVNNTESNLSKYELKDEAVERYDAEIVYHKEPDEVYRSEEDIPKEGEP
jgi:hypothetical protein